jgi:hypothetical protein
MRLANVHGRSTLISSDSSLDDAAGIDVETASEGRFGPGLMDLYENWSRFAAWADSIDVDGSDPSPISPTDLGSPTPVARARSSLQVSTTASTQPSRGSNVPMSCLRSSLSSSPASAARIRRSDFRRAATPIGRSNSAS